MAFLFKREPLTRSIQEVVRATGSDEREAALVADNLVTANLLGHDSHGIGMTPRYVDAAIEGGLKPNQEPATRLDLGTLLVLDGQAGYGQSIGHQATGMAIERAKRHGSCIMLLGNAHHLGRIGHWAEMAVAEGLVSLHFVNVLSFARVAPHGGADGRFGTNPFCAGIPIPGEPPFMLDMATSAVAQGKLRVAHNKGEKVPLGRVIDDQGNPTDDPRWAVVQPFGSMLCFGEHKGYGLAVACELLGGALTGGGTWHYPNSPRAKVMNGMMTILIDAERAGTSAAFARDARAYVDWVRASPPAPGFDRVRIAGEPERETRAQRERDGIPVDESTWNEIRASAVKLRLAPEQIDALARGGGSPISGTPSRPF